IRRPTRLASTAYQSRNLATWLAPPPVNTYGSHTRSCGQPTEAGLHKKELIRLFSGSRSVAGPCSIQQWQRPVSIVAGARATPLAARDHYGLTGIGWVPGPSLVEHATTQMPASAASANSGTNGGTSPYTGGGGGGAPSLVYTGNSAALM